MRPIFSMQYPAYCTLRDAEYLGNFSLWNPLGAHSADFRYDFGSQLRIAIGFATASLFWMFAQAMSITSAIAALLGGVLVVIFISSGKEMIGIKAIAYIADMAGAERFRQRFSEYREREMVRISLLSIKRQATITVIGPKSPQQAGLFLWRKMAKCLQMFCDFCFEPFGSGKLGLHVESSYDSHVGPWLRKQPGLLHFSMGTRSKQ